MSSDTEEKYLYFKVGLLKDSFALEALWQDALRYHMVDQPAKLIAMRLTEYYELTNKGPMQPRATAPMPTISPVFIDRENKEDAETPTSSTPAIRPSVTSPPAAHPPVVHPAAHPPVVHPAAHPPVVHPAAHPPVVHPATHLSTTPAPNTTPDNYNPNVSTTAHERGESSLTVSAEVDQNAEEAADYWSLL
jgi:hypothetical protein